jgi:hypothetical protein
MNERGRGSIQGSITKKKGADNLSNPLNFLVELARIELATS